MKKTLDISALGRVEGEGGLKIAFENGRLVDLNLNIFEPPRLFEAFLRGRHFTEVPDMTSRICAICPLAYALGSILAFESLFETAISQTSRLLRRLIYSGEWLASHSLHIHMLHAPDFLGLHNAFQLHEKHPEVVKRGLKLKQIGNDVMEAVGGRAIHPVNLKPGGFFSKPAAQRLDTLLERLLWAKDALVQAIRWTATLPFPDITQDYVLLALYHPDYYAIDEARWLKCSDGREFALEDFCDVVEEYQVSRSTSFHARFKLDNANYLTGPMARFYLNQNQLTETCLELAHETGLLPLAEPRLNPYKSIIIRAIEGLYACEEAIRLIERLQNCQDSDVVDSNVAIKAGIGHGATEAPRGLCYHRYEVDEKGLIINARITPPTSQNLPIMEADVRAVATAFANLPETELQRLCETAVRNHDPCISCSCH